MQARYNYYYESNNINYKGKFTQIGKAQNIQIGEAREEAKKVIAIAKHLLRENMPIACKGLKLPF